MNERHLERDPAFDLDAIARRILRPDRTQHDHCVPIAEAYRREAAPFEREHNEAMRACERELEKLRANVRASGTGKIPYEMESIERRARHLMRGSAKVKERLARAWNAMAPAAWACPDASGATPTKDEWSVGELPRDIETAVALASDRTGVTRAEETARALAAAFAEWGVAVSRETIAWRVASEAIFDASLDEAIALPARALDDAVRASASGTRALEDAAHLHAKLLAQRGDDAVAHRFADDAARSTLWSYARREGLVVPSEFACAGRPFADLADIGAIALSIWSTGYALAETSARKIVLHAPLPSPRAP